MGAEWARSNSANVRRRQVRRREKHLDRDARCSHQTAGLGWSVESIRSLRYRTEHAAVGPGATGCDRALPGILRPGQNLVAEKWTFSAITDVWAQTGSGHTARTPDIVSRAPRTWPGWSHVDTRDAENADRAISGRRKGGQSWARAGPRSNAQLLCAHQTAVAAIKRLAEALLTAVLRRPKVGGGMGGGLQDGVGPSGGLAGWLVLTGTPTRGSLCGWFVVLQGSRRCR